MYLPNCYFCLLGSLEPVWNHWQVSGAPKGRRCGLRFLWLPVPVLSGFFLAVHMCVLVAQSCRTVCGPMDYSPPGSSVHGILQARILEWVVIPSPGVLPCHNSFGFLKMQIWSCVSLSCLKFYIGSYDMIQTHYCDLWSSAVRSRLPLHSLRDSRHQFNFFQTLPLPPPLPHPTPA